MISVHYQTNFSNLSAKIRKRYDPSDTRETVAGLHPLGSTKAARLSVSQKGLCFLEQSKLATQLFSQLSAEMLVRAVYNRMKQEAVLINHFGPNKICRTCKNYTDASRHRSGAATPLSSCKEQITLQKSFCLRATRTHQQGRPVAPSKLLGEDAGTHLPTDILQQS